MEAWVAAAIRTGTRFGFADLLIGALGFDNGAPVWSLDSDFQKMAGLGWVDLFSALD